MAFLFNGLLGHPFRTTLAVGKFLAFAHLFIEYGYSTAPAVGPSMLPTFDVLGEWLLISRRHRHGRDVAVGDVVIYDIPNNHSLGVKRLLGLPGDYVLVNEPGVGSNNMIQVPQGHCWVVGDNMPASRDSRTFGPIPLALVKGKVLGKIKPFSFQRLENPLRPVD